MRIPPDHFWAMSLVEWRACVTGFQSRSGTRAAPLARTEFEALMERYPDG